jgi:arginase
MVYFSLSLKKSGKQRKNCMKNRFILTPYFLDQLETGLEPLAQNDWYLNKTELPEGETQIRMGYLYQGIADFAADAAAAGERPVSIAGDCCTTIGALAGLQRAGMEVTLIWFDAHGDFNTWETTPSGFLGGMPLAMITGRGEQTIPKAVGLKAWDEVNVILTDGRDLDPGERQALENSSVTRLEDPRMLLENPLPSGALYVHFDTDILDPGEAPAMNYLAERGPSSQELEGVFRYLAKTGQVAAVSMSSWNPQMDEGRTTEQLCMRLFGALAGW